MNKPKYYVSKNDEFVIENYNSSATFSSFFPGIAGVFGVPMWVFYANRGQCVTSFGVQDKDGAIMEFQPANKAYRGAALNGFRTFLKVDGEFYEPFSETDKSGGKMMITPHDLTITAENKALKVSVEVNYFTLPNEKFPALVRTLKIKNLSKKKMDLEALDGLPAMIPCGFNNSLLKNMSQTIEAWSIVENLEKGAPFVRLKVVPSDAPETQLSQRGNFYFSFSNIDKKKGSPKIIVRRRTIFGEVSGLGYPEIFAEGNFKVPASQMKENFIPCAFSHKKAELAPGEKLELFSVIGNIDSVKTLNETKKAVSSKAYIDKKAAENKNLIDGIASRAFTSSSSKNFDLYTKQSFIDNVMRGGLPINLDSKAFYVYYRKHGDMERDYNDFRLLPTYFSQGSGNYRDINQNRRNDVFFNPDVGESNILRFYNLVQMDGFNPLVVLPSKYAVGSKEAASKLAKKHIKENGEAIAGVIQKPFLLGPLLNAMEDNGVRLNRSREEFIADLMTNSSKVEEAQHGEGYWTDHFSYNLDLLESYENIYPDKIKHLIFNKKAFTFFDNDHMVADRKSKYILKGSDVRQFGSVKIDHEKHALMNGRNLDKHIMRTKFGTGEIYRTCLITKLLCIAANKAASFDVEGVGLEMEADKPDWYDALNGLPGLMGSSLSETFELKRMCVYILERLDNDVAAKIPVEIKEFIDGVNSAMAEFFSDGDGFKYWETASSIKENYRNRTRLGIGGDELSINSEYILAFLGNVVKKCDLGIKKTLDKHKTYNTYFINEAVEHEMDGNAVRVKKFKQKPLPLFLEGFVHALKVEKDKKIYQMVKKSALYDKKLKMYKVNAPLAGTPIEIGRAKVFSPGWLENESVWLHMEYKYMLELLKAGMHKEFFNDLKSVLVPFMDPKVYKRSILENSSFISSSAYTDKDCHGRGFIARLSGATAEFLDMWLRMTTGKNIFSMDKNGRLLFKLSPVLPKWLFKNGRFSFTLLGSIKVEYLGSGSRPVSYKIFLEDKEIELKGPSVPEPYSTMIRDRVVKKIIVSLSQK
jgi:hypothetical protein